MTCSEAKSFKTLAFRKVFTQAVLDLPTSDKSHFCTNVGNHSSCCSFWYEDQWVSSQSADLWGDKNLSFSPRIGLPNPAIHLYRLEYHQEKAWIWSRTFLITEVITANKTWNTAPELWWVFSQWVQDPYWAYPIQGKLTAKLWKNNQINTNTPQLQYRALWIPWFYVFALLVFHSITSRSALELKS